MQEITLEKQPNQQFSISLCGAAYVISLRTLANGATLADIEIDNEPLVRGLLCRGNELLLPYPYQARGGTFLFTTAGGRYPYYTDFGGSCRFYFISAEELANANAAA